jgi:outer membrane lipoprotein-sorting protein
MCVATIVLACTSAVAVARQAASRSLLPSPPATPIASQSAAAAREVAAFAQAWADITGYSATVTIFDQQGTQTQNIVFEYVFSKPSNVTVHVIAGPNAGVTLTWNGGATVVAHRGSGLAAMFKKTLSLHDPQVTTLRGSSIDQLSFGAILAHGQQSSGNLSEAAGEVIDGVAANAVTLTAAGPATDAGLTREIVELSTLTHLPTRVLGYEGSTLVRKIDFSNVKLQN